VVLFRTEVILLGLATICWRAETVLAGVQDIPIAQVTRIDSRYTTDNYFGQDMKLIKNPGPPNGDGSEVRGLFAVPQLPSLSAADVYGANIWMCQTWYHGPPNENPYTRGVTLSQLTPSYDLTTVTWQNCNGGQYDSGNPVPWNPASDMALGVNGYWWCHWDFTSLWNNSNLRNNGALVILNAQPPPSTTWVTKDFASNTYGLTQFQPFVEVVQMDQWNGGSSNWSNTSSWNTGTPPDVTDAVAGFLGNATQDRTATVDEPVTVGAIVLDNAAHQYTLTGNGDNSITMSNLSGDAAITVNHGTHVISAPLVLACNTTVTVANASDMLTLGGDISGTGAGLTLAGSGALVLSGDNSYDSGTTVNSGTLYVTNSNALPAGTSLTVGVGATTIFNPSMTGTLASNSQTFVRSTISTVPEPGTLTLLAVTVCGAAVHRHIRSRRKIR